MYKNITSGFFLIDYPVFQWCKYLFIFKVFPDHSAQKYTCCTIYLFLYNCVLCFFFFHSPWTKITKWQNLAESLLGNVPGGKGSWNAEEEGGLPGGDTKVTSFSTSSRICHSKNMSLWHQDYPELKAIETQQIQEKLFTVSTAYIFFGKGSCTRKRTTTRDTFWAQKLTCITEKTLFSKHPLCPPGNVLSLLCIPRPLSFF